MRPFGTLEYPLVLLYLLIVAGIGNSFYKGKSTSKALHRVFRYRLFKQDRNPLFACCQCLFNMETVRGSHDEAIDGPIDQFRIALS